MSIGPKVDQAREAALRMLRRRRTQARAVMLFERVWTAIWPPLGVAGVFLCLALLEVPQSLPAWPHAGLLAVFGLGFLALLARGLRHVAVPDVAMTDRRLEAASGLRHRPLTVLEDAPASGTSDGLWRAHVARATAQLGRLRVGVPRPGLAAIDRRALRGLVVVALFACVVMAGAEAPIRLLRSVQPGFAPPAAPSPTELQAWITPPGYTGQAPVFLKSTGGEVRVPAGSHLTANLTGGGTGVPALILAGRPTEFQRLDAGSYQVDLDLTDGGRLAVRRGGGDVAAWDLSVVADRAPVVRFPEPPSAVRGNARIPATRLPWEVSHDYGVASLKAELRLRDRPDAAPLVVTVPLPGGSVKTAHGVRVQDLTPHPWAGLPVVGRLVATDAPGLVGTSDPAEFTLPERRFANPIARALIEVRKMLSLKPDDRGHAIGALDEIAALEDAWRADAGGFLNLRSAISQLTYDRAPEAVENVQQRLWLLALHLEEGAPERTARALAEARDALKQSLDADKRGEKVDPTEIDRKMQAVREALEKHLQALAEQARRDPDSNKFDPSAQPLDARDLQRLADQARDAAKRGDMDQARDKMAELDKMLQELENGRPEHGKMTERDRQRAQKRQRGQQQMSALQDIVRREGGVLDHSQQRADAATREEQNRYRAAPSPSPDAAANQAAHGTDQRVQQALRRALGELMQQYGDLTGEVPPNLGDADTAMRDAMAALGQGQDAPAAGAARRAIEALQKGGQSMSAQMSRQFGSQGDDQEADDGDGQDGDGQNADGQNGNGQDGPGMSPGGQSGGRQYGDGRGRGTRPWDSSRRADRRADDRRDPLGRPTREGTSGTDESGDVQVPDQMEAARGREIQDELRRRDAERGRPQPELDYIERLLKQF